jgi:GDPmannose 4,6-dehydratase
VAAAAAELKIKISWRGKGAKEKGYDAKGRVIVAVDPRYYRPAEVDLLIGDYSKAKRKLGWSPKTGFVELARLMVDADIHLLRRHREGQIRVSG